MPPLPCRLIWICLCGCLCLQITQAGQDGSQCGIGVVFRMDNHGALVVDSLVPGGPAWESSTQGGLQVSDVLQTVDGKNVYRRVDSCSQHAGSGRVHAPYPLQCACDDHEVWLPSCNGPAVCLSCRRLRWLTLMSRDGRWPVAQLAPLLLGPEGTTVRLGVQRSLPAQNGSSGGGTHEAVLRSLIIDVQRKRFSPPPEPYSASRPPIVDARRGLGQKESVRTSNGGGEGQFTAA